MQRRWGWTWWTVSLAIMFLAGEPGQALVTKPIPLRERLATPYIVVVKVEKIYPEKPGMVLSVDTHLKGELPITRLPINLKGDSFAKKHDHTGQLLKRLKDNLPIILFVDHRITDGSKRSIYKVFAFTNGTWFQVIGRELENKKVSWAFVSCEPYLRRTFAGTTAELRQIIVDGLSGKKKPPEPNDKEKPGLGPEVEGAKEKRKQGVPKSTGESASSFSICLFPLALWLPSYSPAVIPTLGIGGPLAILAMLFPGLFGGALLVLRNWAALLTVAGLNSTLLVLSLWFPRLLRGTWLETGLGLWYVMLGVTLAGTLWAGRGYYRQTSPPAASPKRSEYMILSISSSAFLLAFLLIALWSELGAEDPSWKLLLVFTIGFWAATLCDVARRLLHTVRPSLRPAIPAHLIVLWGMIFASASLAAAWPAQPVAVAGELTAAREGMAQQAWQVVFPKGGFVVSPPLVHGDRVYVAAAHKQGGADTFGTVYCLNAITGKEIWQFDNDGEMFQVFSAPTLVEGKLYIGEGFHENKGCRLYCLDATSGKKIWDFPTESHTESSPFVAGGKVYFGAGDDGVYCVDAKSGKKVWQYPGEKGDTVPTIFPKGEDRPRSNKPIKLHVDASPIVQDGRLYVGSGVDRDAPGCAPAVFCLNALSGKKIWLMPLLNDSLPVWGSPVASEGAVYFGVGNGDIMSDATKPAGALLCVDAGTGAERWRYVIPNSILRKPALDSRSVYFGCRDGFCYCIDRKTGKPRWRKDVGSPIIASATFFRCPHCGANRLYVLGTKGQVACLDPETGFQLWQMSYGEGTLLGSSPCVAGVATPQGERRRIYFGAGLANADVAALICLEEK